MLALIAGICGDMGMCVVYLFIFAVMAWGAGVKKRWFLLAGSALVIGFAVLWIFILPNTAAWDSLYLVKRFRVLFDHSYDPQGIVFSRPAPSWLWAPGSCSARATSTEHDPV